ncbi:MAG: type II toxin-antitoxin system YafQ family toxin [Sulfurovum sp.]|nr:type II toxin-antitoxin system YafQ family toxin [Sulfurovum sp.]
MVLKVKQNKSFFKDLRKTQLSDKHFSKYIVYISKLIEEVPLPKEALSHPLKGKYEGYFEFHISGDVLVIYKIKNDELWLIRIGSHSELFSK